MGQAVTGTTGTSGLSAITVQAFDAASGMVSGSTRRIAADCLAVSGGWSPVIHLASQAGHAPRWNEQTAGLPAARTHADLARRRCRHRQRPRRPRRSPRVARPVLRPSARRAAVRAAAVGRCAGDRPSPRAGSAHQGPGKAFVDFQHDVTADDVELAHREGFVSVEHLKRYTTLGMATDQGKTSNVPGLAIMAAARALPIPEVGTTRFRPPFSPVTLAAIAAERHGDLRAERLTPMHDWHVEHGAVMQAAGLWFRPQIYGQPGETVEQAYVREAKAVREGVGIVDVSTLGKIAVQGPDAAEFLDRVYTNMFSTLKVGKARYGLMLREDGLALTTARPGGSADNEYPDDHHHGQCREGDAAARIFPRRGVARPEGAPDLGDRRMGGRGDRRAEIARRACGLRHRHGGGQRDAALHGHRPGRDRRRAGDDLPALLLGRAAPTRSIAAPAMAPMCGRR